MLITPKNGAIDETEYHTESSEIKLLEVFATMPPFIQYLQYFGLVENVFALKMSLDTITDLFSGQV